MRLQAQVDYKHPRSLVTHRTPGITIFATTPGASAAGRAASSGALALPGTEMTINEQNACLAAVEAGQAWEP